MTTLLGDLKVLYYLALRPVRGRDHAARMENFYHGQAEAYDGFRRRLLPGREAMFQAVPFPEGGVWVDLGGGTGANLEHLGDRIQSLRKVYVVDLADSLLAIARARAEKNGWRCVETVRADATTFRPAEAVDVATFSYSLTMIPDWFAAVENARAMLKPGGTLAAVDFFIARKHPGEGMAGHDWLTRTFWPFWFALDNVFLSPDHVPMLQRSFQTLALRQERAKVPYLPLGRVPYYVFVGKKL